MAFAPLGHGIRPGPLEDPTVLAIARQTSLTPAQVLLAWHVQRGISVIPKSITPSRLRENFAAAEIQLTAADIELIAGLDRKFRFVGGGVPWVMEGGPWTLQTVWDEP